MNKILKSGLLAAVLFTVSAQAYAVLIDFEGLTDGEVVTSQFPEVVFSANAGFENQITAQPGIGFGDNFICTAPIGGAINCTEETILTFTDNVNNLLFWQVGDDSSGVVALVDVFENGAFSSTVDILGFNDFNTPNLVDLTSFTNVSSIRIHSVTDPGGLGWDNFEFDVMSTEVPAPSSLALLGLVLAGIGLSRKRKTA